MPTGTFFKISEEKKHKIIEAAKEEFANVPFEKASIQNIVKNSEIARRKFLSVF